MPWVVTIRNLVADRVQVVTPDMVISHDDPTYENEVHFVPVFYDKRVKNPEAADLLFGIHECVRDCVCGPQIIRVSGERDKVIHNLIN
jgi:hypothetical protein